MQEYYFRKRKAQELEKAEFLEKILAVKYFCELELQYRGINT